MTRNPRLRVARARASTHTRIYASAPRRSCKRIHALRQDTGAIEDRKAEIVPVCGRRVASGRDAVRSCAKRSFQFEPAEHTEPDNEHGGEGFVTGVAIKSRKCALFEDARTRVHVNLA